MRVLIVEDNEDIALVTGLLVQVLGHEPQICYSPDAAFDLVKSWVPELVITDIGLPGMDGYALAPALHNKPGLENVPIFALSSFPDDRSRRIRAGIKAHYMKPIALADLKGMLVAAE